ncbi:hypothetical protein AB1L88_10850 [Tautonia sp. JC769]|uniref:hypothetical protein n=1 Tax=Tautonia sp. JC769 TaxID=3232135 RepID=UPI00345A8667
MRTADEYLLDLSESPEQMLANHAGRVFDAAWRVDFSAPGFCLIDLGPGVGSLDLRSLMLGLKGHLDGIAADRGISPFRYRSMGRFDQQETTKFHLDGAPDRSLLMLGYEPSVVCSRLSLADYARCAYDLGIEPRQFLRDYNPMFRRGEELLAPQVTELPEPAEGHARILLINNSSLPYAEAGTNPLGVLHRAEIPDPSRDERRIVNSIMLVVADEPDSAEVGEEQRREFATTDRISEKTST